MPGLRELFWDESSVEHIARHHVAPEEVEEVWSGRHWMIRSGRRRRAVFGQTAAGRYLLVVVEKADDYGEFALVTARDMDRTERRRFQIWRGRR
jgi:uncharacterized DUF497 family protein